MNIQNLLTLIKKNKNDEIICNIDIDNQKELNEILLYSYKYDNHFIFKFCLENMKEILKVEEKTILTLMLEEKFIQYDIDFFEKITCLKVSKEIIYEEYNLFNKNHLQVKHPEYTNDTVINGWKSYFSLLQSKIISEEIGINKTNKKKTKI